MIRFKERTSFPTGVDRIVKSRAIKLVFYDRKFGQSNYGPTENIVTHSESR